MKVNLDIPKLGGRRKEEGRRRKQIAI